MKVFALLIFLLTSNSAFALGNCSQYLSIRTSSLKNNVDEVTVSYINGMLDGVTLADHLMGINPAFKHNSSNEEILSYLVNYCLENPNDGMLIVGAKFLVLKRKQLNSK